MAEELAAELDASDARHTVEQAYRGCLGANQDLLGVCTDWQLREVDGEIQLRGLTASR